MGLVANSLKYETKIKGFKDISPESIKEMFYDIKSSISKLENSFENFEIKEILKIIQTGEYKIKGDNFDYKIDLSDPKAIISSYRLNSEGGCQSCVSNKTYVIDAQDHSSQSYCGVGNPYYFDIQDLREKGLTDKIRKHYQSPCKDWKPTFSPTIEKLLE